jgi:hypothetical protein
MAPVEDHAFALRLVQTDPGVLMSLLRAAGALPVLLRRFTEFWPAKATTGVRSRPMAKDRKKRMGDIS